jgi:hypothetical protein
MSFVFADFINTTVAVAFPSSSTVLQLSSSVGLPTLSAGQIMPITLNDASTGLIYEIVYVTSITGANLTVTRAQEGTTAQNWSIGDFVLCAPTAGTVMPLVRFEAAGVPTGALNGSNVTYTLPQTPVGSVPIYINGVYGIVGTDYSISGVTITKLGTPLTSTENISYGEYRY